MDILLNLSKRVSPPKKEHVFICDCMMLRVFSGICSSYVKTGSAMPFQSRKNVCRPFSVPLLLPCTGHKPSISTCIQVQWVLVYVTLPVDSVFHQAD